MPSSEWFVVQIDTGVIPPEFIDEVLSRIDIVEIIEPRVALKKQGKDYTGLCPFHNEKSPSFSVSQDKQFYYCFGCQAFGSALKFLTEYDHMDFVSAVEMLAAKAGMEVPRQDDGVSSEVRQQRRSIYEILELASKFFKDQLRSHNARDRAVSYLKDRGVSGEIARDFALGYAPPEWDSLQLSLATSNFDRGLLIQSGMLIENTEEDRTYDRFRDRVMFPIRDLRGRTIAFGGRIIGDGKPKYLNSPETPVFHKGRELYGLFEAKQRTAQLSRVIVVEGYMDVVALAQHGITYSVATLGTATTPDHIERLFRLVSKIIFCFDGDEAGRKAAWKALNTSLEFLQDGRSAAFLFLPEGEDPDSLVRAEGKDAFELRLSRATSFNEFLYASLEVDLDMASPEGKAALSKLAMPIIHQIPEGVFKQLIIDDLSTRTGLDRDRLLSVSVGYSKPREPRSGPSDNRWERSPPARLDSRLDLALSMLLIQPELAGMISSAEYDRLAPDQSCRLLTEVIDMINTGENLDGDAILEHYKGKPESDYLQDLATRDQLLDVSQFADEFKGILEQRLANLDDQFKRQLIEALLAKPFAELTESERAIIRDHYQDKR